jgi:hypothetical protein
MQKPLGNGHFTVHNATIDYMLQPKPFIFIYFNSNKMEFA